MRRIVSGTLLALGTIVVVLALAEAGCRLAGYRGLETYRPDAELGWVLEPGQETVTRVGRLPVTINADGFRDAPLSPSRTDSVIRIFALGGSTTFGWGVRQEDAYHQVLERMLNDTAQARGRAVRFQVVNAGVIGYNLWQVAKSMRRIAHRYRPHGYLIAYTFNDGWNPIGTLDPDRQKAMMAGVRRKNILRSSALFNWLIDLRTRRLSAAAGSKAGGELAMVQTADTAGSASQLASFRATVDSMIGFADSARLALGFTVLAARGQDRAWPRQASMAAVGMAAGLPIVDLVPVFSARDPDAVYLPHDGVHPSVLGHRIIAELTYGSLCAAAARARAGEATRVYRAGCPGASGQHKRGL